MSPQLAQTAKGSIEYRLEGNGPVVMVLNGGHCTRDTRLSHERLAEHGFTVLTPSRPGYDATPSEVGRTTQEAADALAALLDTLQIATADVIGISAAGPTALVFAQRHTSRIRKLILESAVSLPWGEGIKRLSHLGFGRAERVTWALEKGLLKLWPGLSLRLILHELTVLNVDEVIERMSKADLQFVRRMIETSQSGTGFVTDIEHRVDNLSGIAAPTLAMYSPYDKSVSPENSKRLAAEVAACELYEVAADTHLIWIGPDAEAVWQKRLAFLKGS